MFETSNNVAFGPTKGLKGDVIPLTNLIKQWQRVKNIFTLMNAMEQCSSWEASSFSGPKKFPTFYPNRLVITSHHCSAF
jgi:hypothetical protein